MGSLLEQKGSKYQKENHSHKFLIINIITVWKICL